MTPVGVSAAGLCQAALNILRSGANSKHAGMVRIVWRFISFISPLNRPPRKSAAMAVLVSGGFVELAVAHMVEAGPDMLKPGVGLLKHFMKDPRARERICAPRMMDSVMKWFTNQFAQVRFTAVWQVSVMLVAGT